VSLGSDAFWGLENLEALGIGMGLESNDSLTYLKGLYSATSTVLSADQNYEISLQQSLSGKTRQLDRQAVN
jgi:hypothetical protein